MRAPVAQLQARAGVGAILAHPAWRELHALPVVDEGGLLVGVLRREVYEELRERPTEPGTSSSTNVGLALAELFWGMSASLVDQIGASGRTRPSSGGRK
jgi:hypothetical protein